MTGLPVVYAIKPHEQSTDQRHPLGTMGFTNDGRIYRYANAGGSDLDPGKLAIAVDIDSNQEDIAVNTFTIGETTMTVTAGATISANEYDEGFVNITSSTGEGIMYSIKSHDTVSGSGSVVLTLNDVIAVTAVAGTKVTLVKNKYKDIIVSDGTLADLPVGVSNITISANAFGWIQTGGLCSVLNDQTTTVVAGKPVTIGDVTSGAVEDINAVTEPQVGLVPAGAVGATTEYVPINLTLDKG